MIILLLATSVFVVLYSARIGYKAGLKEMERRLKEYYGDDVPEGLNK